MYTMVPWISLRLVYGINCLRRRCHSDRYHDVHEAGRADQGAEDGSQT